MRMFQTELELKATPAMRRGESKIDQCSWCGALVVHEVKKLSACPACGHNDGWWRQTLPVGPFTRSKAD